MLFFLFKGFPLLGKFSRVLLNLSLELFELFLLVFILLLELFDFSRLLV